MRIESNSRILFQGDSITDCGRDRADFNSLSGYAQMISDYIKTFHADKNIEILNRGISGDTTEMLLERIDRDCIDLKPNVISFLIGINDVWRKYDSNSETTIEAFKENYTNILTEVKRKLNCKIIIMEPFLIPSDNKKAIFREDLDPKITVVRELASKFAEEYIPLDGIFAEAVLKNTPQYYSGDGVHPSREGNSLIAREWLKRVTF